MSTALPDDVEELLVRTCRTAVGDELRSVTYFTPDEVEKLYLREDLHRDADLVGFVENERHGFRSQSVYGESELGDYRSTIRMFEEGYLTRVIVGDHGVFVTTDPMEIDRFEELTAALVETLDGLD